MGSQGMDIVKKMEEAKINLADINAIKTKGGLYEVVGEELNLLEQGYEYTSIDVFTSALLGLIANDFSGVVYLKINSSDKKLYIHKGQIVFASSTMIDDRLGEVIYRKGLITLDQMTEAAVKVTRKLKFGRVMIESNIFNSIDLWEGLKSQVLCILQSIFLEKQILYKMSRDYVEPPTAVLFEESTDTLVKKYASVGYAYQIFRGDLNQVDSIRMIDSLEEETSDNTYFSDINHIVSQNKRLEDYLSCRRLNESYSILDIFELCHMGVATIDQQVEVQLNYKSHGRNSTVKSLIDAYQMISKEVYEYFKAQNTGFPLSELKSFLRMQYFESGCLLYVGDDLSLEVGALRQIISVSEKYNFACEMIESDLKALIYFVLQILGDIGPGAEAWKLKQKLSALVV